MGELFTYETLRLETRRGRRGVLVITPKIDVQVHSARLSTIEQEPRGPDENDSDILVRARELQGRVQLAIFRGRNDAGDGSWGFAQDVGEDVATALALAMLPSHLAVWRGMVRLGLCLFMHVEWGPREAVAFGKATDIMVAKLEAEIAAGQDAERATVDLWILKNLTFYTSLGLPKVVDKILPEKLALMETRMDRIQKMAMDLPA